MILTNIIDDSKVGEFTIANETYPVIKLDSLVLDPKINSIGDLVAWINKEYDKTMTKDSFMEIWESLFLGTNRFKISDRLRFQIDPINTYMELDGTWGSNSNSPYSNEISSSNLTSLQAEATNRGYVPSGLVEVPNTIKHEMYNEDMTKSTRTEIWKSRVSTDEVGGEVDLYAIVNDQHKFLNNLRSQVLEASFALPAKNLPTKPTLGNTVPAYGYGDYVPHNVLSVHVHYVNLAGELRKINTKLIRTKDIDYAKSDIIDGVQVLWVINGDKSFIKVLWDESLVEIASIKEAKLSGELPTENTDSLLGENARKSYLTDDQTLVIENKPINIDVLANDNLY